MIVVAGGHSRNVGKTTLVVELIASLPEFAWTALKITGASHGLGTRHGHDRENETADAVAYILTEQSEPDSTDTGRFLAAGARRAFWLRTRPGALAQALPAIRGLIRKSPNTIIESNSVLEFLEPDLYLLAADPGQPDWKASALRFLSKAGAFVLAADGDTPWLPANRPRFRIDTPAGRAALAGFVRERAKRQPAAH